MKLLLVNGPNMDLLGAREPEIYGSYTLEEVVACARKVAGRLGAELDDFQSNEEGALVTRIGRAGGEYDGIIINPAAYTHTSVALRDAIKASGLPAVEVHMSNIHAREDFRSKSLTAPSCVALVSGFGAASYEMAVEGLIKHILKEGRSE